MLTINDGGSFARVLELPIDERLKTLLRDRQLQLCDVDDLADLARFVIVETSDSAAALDQELGFSVFQNPVDGRLFGDPEFSLGCEWIEDHGFCFELVFIFDDSGFAHVVLVPNREEADERLLALCRSETAPAE